MDKHKGAAGCPDCQVDGDVTLACADCRAMFRALDAGEGLWPAEAIGAPVDAAADGPVDLATALIEAGVSDCEIMAATGISRRALGRRRREIRAANRITIARA